MSGCAVLTEFCVDNYAIDLVVARKELVLYAMVVDIGPSVGIERLRLHAKECIGGPISNQFVKLSLKAGNLSVIVGSEGELKLILAIVTGILTGIQRDLATIDRQLDTLSRVCGRSNSDVAGRDDAEVILKSLKDIFFLGLRIYILGLRIYRSRLNHLAIGRSELDNPVIVNAIACNGLTTVFGCRIVKAEIVCLVLLAPVDDILTGLGTESVSSGTYLEG